MTAIDPGLRLRHVMSRMPTGVTVVTTPDDGRTMNSFTSVSLDPPLVSVCLATSSSFFGPLSASAGWGVSVLAHDQQDVARRFAARGVPDRLAGVAHAPGPVTGAALLDGAVCTLECRTISVQEAGDHAVVIAEVLALDVMRDSPALVFYRGGFLTVG